MTYYCLARNLPANRHQGYPTNVPKVALSKEETGGRRERRSERIEAEGRIENRNMECSDFEG